MHQRVADLFEKDYSIENLQFIVWYQVSLSGLSFAARKLTNNAYRIIANVTMSSSTAKPLNRVLGDHNFASPPIGASKKPFLGCYVWDVRNASIALP